MPAIPPESWEYATPVFGIRYPKPSAPAKYLPDAFGHIGTDLETALVADQATPPGLNYVTGTNAARLAATPAKDQIWIVTDVAGNPKYIGTGTAWIAFTAGLETVEYRPSADVFIPAGGGLVAWLGAASGTTGLVSRSGPGTVFTLLKAGLWRIDIKESGDVAAGATMMSRLQVNGGNVTETAVYVAGNSDRAATAWGAHYVTTANATTTIGFWLSSAAAFAMYSWSQVRFTYLGTAAAGPTTFPTPPDPPDPTGPEAIGPEPKAAD